MPDSEAVDRRNQNTCVHGTLLEEACEACRKDWADFHTLQGRVAALTAQLARYERLRVAYAAYKEAREADVIRGDQEMTVEQMLEDSRKIGALRDECDAALAAVHEGEPRA